MHFELSPGLRLSNPKTPVWMAAARIPPPPALLDAWIQT
jgi:hypothetical protein